MNQELQNKLFEKYPDLFREKDLPMSQTCMCWGIETADGWYQLIDTLCEAIASHVKNRPSLFSENQVTFGQIKEKWGGLRVDLNNSDEYIDGLVAMAERMSYAICENCGNPGKPNKKGWICVRCESCGNKNESI